MLRSSINFITKTNMSKDEHKKCVELLSKLFENQDSIEFR
jgi:hypothetical protein